MGSRREMGPIDCKIYVGGLPETASRSELEVIFARYGRLRNVWVARRPPGFAFIEFEDPRDAEDAARALVGIKKYFKLEERPPPPPDDYWFPPPEVEVGVRDGQEIDLRPDGHENDEAVEDVSERRGRWNDFNPTNWSIGSKLAMLGFGTSLGFSRLVSILDRRRPHLTTVALVGAFYLYGKYFVENRSRSPAAQKRYRTRSGSPPANNRGGSARSSSPRHLLGSRD